MNSAIRHISSREALSVIQSDQRVFIHDSAHTLTYLLTHLGEEAGTPQYGNRFYKCVWRTVCKQT